MEVIKRPVAELFKNSVEPPINNLLLHSAKIVTLTTLESGNLNQVKS